ncbi:MAG: hypothetical protein GC145_17175 [Caulobacter sp.]|nr:hypothetical protein [Caulobacter sp.]
MRPLMIAAAVLALPMTVPAVARAQTADLTTEFQTICIANRTDMSRSVAVAESRGYSRMAIDAPDGVDSVTVLTRIVGQYRWAVVIGRGGSPARGGRLGQVFTACSVTAPKVGSGGADGVRRWVGVTAQEATEAKTSYLFTESSGRRSAIDPDDEAAVTAALKAGGYYLLQIDVNDTSTIATLTRSTPAP